MIVRVSERRRETNVKKNKNRHWLWSGKKELRYKRLLYLFLMCRRAERRRQKKEIMSLLFSFLNIKNLDVKEWTQKAPTKYNYLLAQTFFSLSLFSGRFVQRNFLCIFLFIENRIFCRIYISCAPPSSHSLNMNFNINLNQFMIFSLPFCCLWNFSSSFYFYSSRARACSHQQTLNLFQLQLTRLSNTRWC
jgi:hypothetical protein